MIGGAAVVWLLDEDHNRVRNLAVAVLVAALAISIAWGNGQASRNRAVVRALEAANVDDIDGLVVAYDGALDAAVELRDTIVTLESRVPDVRIVETLTAVSNPINVQLRDLVHRQTDELERREIEFDEALAVAVANQSQLRPECAGLIAPADCPRPTLPEFEFQFRVGTSSARLESNAGNTFAVGSNTIYEGPSCEGDLDAAGCTTVGTAPWSADLTALVKAPVASRSRLLGWYAGSMYSISAADLRSTTTCHPDDDHCEPTAYRLTASNLRFYGGVELRGKRHGIRFGGFVGDATGLDLSYSYHRER